MSLTVGVGGVGVGVGGGVVGGAGVGGGGGKVRGVVLGRDGAALRYSSFYLLQSSVTPKTMASYQNAIFQFLKWFISINISNIPNITMDNLLLIYIHILFYAGR